MWILVTVLAYLGNYFLTFTSEGAHTHVFSRYVLVVILGVLLNAGLCLGDPGRNIAARVGCLGAVCDKLAGPVIPCATQLGLPVVHMSGQGLSETHGKILCTWSWIWIVPHTLQQYSGAKTWPHYLTTDQIALPATLDNAQARE